MMFALHLRQEAELDLEDAALWYEEQNTGLGHQFLDEASVRGLVLPFAPKHRHDSTRK
jgi:hypothetical protein